MKYIDAERLRARIEKDLTFDNSIDTSYYIGRRDAERSILDLIDSLQQEQPDVDSEEAVFKEWGTTKEEYLAKSMDKVHLEMEISTYLKDWEDDEEIGWHLSTDNGCIPIELEDVRDLARHFAQWGAEHLKK